MVQLSGGTDLDQMWNALDNVTRAAARRQREENLWRREILVLVERGGVDGRLHETERDRHGRRWHHRLEKFAELTVEPRETSTQLVVFVRRQIARMDAHRERCQRAGQLQHRLVERGWMPAARLVHVPQRREK